MSKKDKGRLHPFVPLLISTIDSPAWRQLSHSAQMLYVALKRRAPRERNAAYLSFRHARDELRARPQKIADCFRELAHYGFIVKLRTVVLASRAKANLLTGDLPSWGEPREQAPMDCPKDQRATSCDGMVSSTSAQDENEHPAITDAKNGIPVRTWVTHRYGRW